MSMIDLANLICNIRLPSQGLFDPVWKVLVFDKHTWNQLNVYKFIVLRIVT